MTNMPMRRIVVADGAVSRGEVEAALEEQAETRERIREVLVRRGVDPEVVARALARQLWLPCARNRVKDSTRRNE